ncbi:hypothetical protein Trydic_g3763 [Trypoxylus dichotomus]
MSISATAKYLHKIPDYIPRWIRSYQETEAVDDVTGRNQSHTTTIRQDKAIKGELPNIHTVFYIIHPGLLIPHLRNFPSFHLPAPSLRFSDDKDHPIQAYVRLVIPIAARTFPAEQGPPEGRRRCVQFNLMDGAHG